MFIDFGASAHMVNDGDCLENKKELLRKHLIKVADSRLVLAIAKGTINKVFKLEDVLLVPKLDANLVSATKLVSKGYKIILDDTIESQVTLLLPGE